MKQRKRTNTQNVALNVWPRLLLTIRTSKDLQSNMKYEKCELFAHIHTAWTKWNAILPPASCSCGIHCTSQSRVIFFVFPIFFTSGNYTSVP